eukprot:1757413-Rhodomonas_salina.2
MVVPLLVNTVKTQCLCSRLRCVGGVLCSADSVRLTSEDTPACIPVLAGESKETERILSTRDEMSSEMQRLEHTGSLKYCCSKIAEYRTPSTTDTVDMHGNVTSKNTIIQIYFFVIRMQYINGANSGCFIHNNISAGSYNLLWCTTVLHSATA